jgi:hypothetical protein
MSECLIAYEARELSAKPKATDRTFRRREKPSPSEWQGLLVAHYGTRCLEKPERRVRPDGAIAPGARQMAVNSGENRLVQAQTELTSRFGLRLCA